MEIAIAFHKEREVFLDMETSGLDPFTGRPWITSLYFDNGTVFNVNMWYVDLCVIKEFLESRVIVGAELKFDLKWLRHLDIRPRKVMDVIIHSRIFNTGLHLPNALAVLAKKHLGVELQKDLRTRWITDPRELSILTKCPEWSEEMHRYAACDVYVLPDILREQIKLARKENLMDTIRLENSLVPVVADMEYDGVLVDKARWDEIVAIAKIEMTKLKESVARELVGTQIKQSLFDNPMDLINLDSPLVVKEAFEKKGIHLDNLSKLTMANSKNKLAKQYSTYKEYAKQVQTYGDKWIACIHPMTGRVHSSFLQLSDSIADGDSEGQSGGTDTARFSSKGPNVQNVPHNRHNEYPVNDPYWTSEEAIKNKEVYDPSISDWSYRDCFVAPPGYKLVICDLSQAEVRILADVSQDTKLIADIASGIDIHTAVAASMFKKDPKAITKEERAKGKTLNFAVIYGLGAASLAQRLGLVGRHALELRAKNPRMSMEVSEDRGLKIAMNEAQGLIDAYFKAYPGVKAWLSWARAQPALVGYSTTVISRKRFYGEVPEHILRDPEKLRMVIGNRQRQGANSPIQGTCADMTKKAMCAVATSITQKFPGARLVNSVHDEIIVEVPEADAEAMAKNVEHKMITAANSMLKTVKMAAEVSVADRWIK
jgi:DNA polymerase-1